MNEKQPEFKLVLAGLGGQGVIFTTRLLAQAAANRGRPVMVSEVHGMSQRGGSVISHLKIGSRDKCLVDESPLIHRGTANLLLALAADEAVRNLAFLRQSGTVLTNAAQSSLRPELSPYLEQLNIRVHCLPASQIAMALGSAAVTNTIMVGFAAAHPSLPLSIDTVRETLVTVAPRRRELNLEALETGYTAGLEQMKQENDK